LPAGSNTGVSCYENPDRTRKIMHNPKKLSGYDGKTHNVKIEEKSELQVGGLSVCIGLYPIATSLRRIFRGMNKVLSLLTRIWPHPLGDICGR